MRKSIPYTVVLLLAAAMSFAQEEPYRGGIADGSASGGLISFDPGTYINAYRPFGGGAGDGHSAQALSAFTPAASATLYSPFFGGIADGAASGNAIDFDPRSYITMYRPFSGGVADGWGTSNSIFYNVPLSTTIFDFYGKQEDGEHHLYWKTGSETGLASYEIERSPDLSRFSSIGKTDAGGKGEYHWIDQKPYAGKNFYRIRMNEKDGSTSYSTTVLLMQDEKGGQLIIYPNPAREVMYVEIPDGKGKPVSYSIMDNTGKIIQQANYLSAPSKLTIDLGRLSASTYVLLVKWNNDIHSFKIVKVN